MMVFWIAERWTTMRDEHENRDEHQNEPRAEHRPPPASSANKTSESRKKPSSLFIPRKVSSQLNEGRPNSRAPTAANGTVPGIYRPRSPQKIVFPAPPLPTVPLQHRSHSPVRQRSPGRYDMEPMDPVKATNALKSLLSGTVASHAENEPLLSAAVDGLGVTLMEHQVEGLRFLLRRESNAGHCKGGILADDMGLGKTIQSLALILKNPSKSLEAPCDPTLPRDGIMAEQAVANKLVSSAPHVPKGSNVQKNGSCEQQTPKGPSVSATPVKTGATLVVAPLALIRQWESEIQTKTNLSCIVHHGGNRKSHERLLLYDVIITTYQILITEHAARTGVFQLDFHRIILDEAHMIKNKSAKSSIAATDLQGLHRWCLTGTPLQNSVDELFSLFRFLRASPLDDPHEFRDKISRPMSESRGAIALKRLRVILSAIMLRRTKQILKNADIILPPRRINRVAVDFSPAERAFYKNLELSTSSTLDRLMQGGQIGRNYTNVLVLLLRLRQACNHPHLVSLDYRGESEAIGADGDVDLLADILGGMQVRSGRFCQVCLRPLGEQETSQNCSGCQTELDKAKDLTTSAKITKMMEILRGERRKTIIFSQFTSMLEQIAPFLTAAGIRFAKYYGSMPNAKREASLQALRDDTETLVLLCSLKCGALGLNLIAANRVILIDPWWNPQVSEQAIDRVHRIGQHRPVDVYEITITSSVEERILLLQEKKRKLAQAAMGEGGPLKMNTLSLQDMLFLFKTQAEIETM